jgi:predicted nucleotidyltransferase
MGKERDKTIRILKEFKNKIKKRINLKCLILFGSRARGNAREDSDFDIILVSEDFNGQKSYKRPVDFYIDWNEDYNTDIICLTPKELSVKRKQIGIIKNAMKEGVEIR